MQTIIVAQESKVKLFGQLLKVRLSSMVVFSGGFGYLLAIQGQIDWLRFALFCLASFLITGSANTINQIIEKDSDRLMKRTANRPLPTRQLTVNEAIVFSLILGVLGISILALTINVLSAILGLLSLLLYGFIYTPLKSKSSIAVFVGALPGALPPLIGWVAGSGMLSFEAFTIFTIQFLWQFPHFWAIAWVSDEEYARAGIQLLPSRHGRSWMSAFNIMAYTLFLIPAGLMPYYFGISGLVSGVIAILVGIMFFIPTILLLQNPSKKNALRIMFASFFYLPIVQIAYLLDKL